MKEYSNRIKLSEDGRAIEFRRGSNRNLYDIDLRQISSAGELVDMLYHLKDKADVTPKDLFDFIMAVEKACDLHFGANPRDLFCTGGGQVKWPK